MVPFGIELWRFERATEALWLAAERRSVGLRERSELLRVDLAKLSPSGFAGRTLLPKQVGFEPLQVMMPARTSTLRALVRQQLLRESEACSHTILVEFVSHDRRFVRAHPVVLEDPRRIEFSNHSLHHPSSIVRLKLDTTSNAGLDLRWSEPCSDPIRLDERGPKLIYGHTEGSPQCHPPAIL